MNYSKDVCDKNCGTKRHSGRYTWGANENPYQHPGNFLARVEGLKKLGMSDTEIAMTMGYTTSQFLSIYDKLITLDGSVG